MGKIKGFGLAALVLLVAIVLFSSPAAAAETQTLSFSHHQSKLSDGKENSSVTVSEPLTVSSEEGIQTLYLIFYNNTENFTVSNGTVTVEVEGKFLRRTVDLTELFGEAPKEVTITFAQSVRLTEIYGFADAALPSWVQVWSDPCEKADLCLFSTHADDEQLFFAGILPYYAGEKKLAVQVIYFTDHVNEPLRRHELLRGLWTVGVTAYPVISPFPDLYSESMNQAQNQFNNRGFSREDVVAFQTEMLRRFRPLVVVGHDPEGEYGHGQHRLNSSTLQEAVTLAGDAAQYPESAQRYGVWEVPKTYLHLYGENPIVMDWDVPLSSFDGKTAFQVSQSGFACHGSQQYTWFRTWLNGNSGQITKASQITTYSPCQFGLFRSTVGSDEAKNDFFEHLKTYEEQRLEEEARRREEARTALGERLSLSAEASILRRQEAIRQKTARLAEEAAKQQKTLVTGIALTVVVLAVTAAVLILPKRRKPRRRR